MIGTAVLGLCGAFTGIMRCIFVRQLPCRSPPTYANLVVSPQLARVSSNGWKAFSRTEARPWRRFAFSIVTAARANGARADPLIV